MLSEFIFNSNMDFLPLKISPKFSVSGSAVLLLTYRSWNRKTSLSLHYPSADHLLAFIC